MAGGDLNETPKDWVSRLEEQVGTPSIDSLLSLLTQMEKSEAFVAKIRNFFATLQNDVNERLCIVKEDMLTII